jgi:hypothetical protein
VGLYRHSAANNAEQGQNAGSLGLKQENQTKFIRGWLQRRKPKDQIVRAFSWETLGKSCIRMRQDRTKNEVIQDTLFGFFSEKRA